MTLQTATNPQTGERVALVGGQWLPITETASNPQTGERVGLINNEWMPIPSGALTPREPKQYEETPADQSVFREVADVPLKLVGGVTTGIRLIADAFGADNSISQNLRGAEDWIGKLYSAQSKQDSAEVGRIMKEAEDKGVADQVLAGLKAFTVAPVDLLVNALGTSAPAIAAGLLAAVSAPVGVGAMITTGAVMGAGTVKSAIYDATKEILAEKTAMSPEQIEQAAIKAQEYEGENLDQILLGAGLVGLSSATGGEAALARTFAKSIISRATAKKALTEGEEAAVQAAAKTTAEKAVETETKKLAERGILKQAGITGAKDFAGEGAEGGQEQFAANLAQQRQGFDTPLMRGVVGQATLEGMAGLGMGAVGGANEAAKAKRDVMRSDIANALRDNGVLDEDNIDAEAAKILTAEGDEANKARVGFTPSTAEAFASATDEQGNPLVAGSVKADITGEDVTPETEAMSYLAERAKGQKKANLRSVNNVLDSLGIEHPAEKGLGYVARAEAAIKEHLIALEVQKNATDTGTTGEGTGVAGQPGVNIGTPGITAGDVNGGVANVGADPQRLTAGTNAEPATLEDVNGGVANVGADPYPFLTALQHTTQRLAAGTNAEADPYPFLTALQHTAQRLTAGTNAEPATLEDVPDLTTSQVAPPTTPAVTPEITVLRDLVLQEQRAAGWNTDWPFIPADLGMADFRKLIATDPGLSLEERKQVFAAGEKLGVIPQSENVEDYLAESVVTPEVSVEQQAATDKAIEIQNLINEGENPNNIQKKINVLNQFERKNKLPITKFGNKLSARLPKGEVKANRYEAKNLPADAETNYNKAREWLNADVDVANTRRVALNNDIVAAGQELDRLTDILDKIEQSTGAEAKQTPMYAEADTLLKQKIAAAETKLKEAENKLVEHGTVQNKIDPWNKLDAADKDIFFGKIVYGNMPEYRGAAKALQKYRTERGVVKRETGVKARSEEELENEAGEKRLANAYNENKNGASKILDTPLPEWNRLSEEAKDIFRKANTGIRSATNKVVYSITGEQQDAGFEAVGRHLIETEAKKQKYSPEVIKQRKDSPYGTEARRAREKAEQERLEKIQKEYERIVLRDRESAKVLPNDIISDIQKGNTNQALESLIKQLEAKNTSTYEKIQLNIAKALLGLNLKTTISVSVDGLPDNDLGQYDPIHNHVTLDAVSGLTPKTFLHELVHAASVQVLDHYLNGRLNRLTANQIAGAKQIIDIMRQTKPLLGAEFSEAYENPYEFLAYAITDEKFAAALREANSGISKIISANGTNIESILPSEYNMWGAFKQAIARILNISKGAMKSPNFLMEMHAAFEDILTSPLEAIYIEGSLAAKKAVVVKTATNDDADKYHNTNGLNPKTKEYHAIGNIKPSKTRQVIRRMFTREGWAKNARDFQNKSYYLYRWQDQMNKLGKTIHDLGGKFNDVGTQRDLAMAQGQQYAITRLQKHMDTIRRLADDYIKKYGLTVEEFLNETHQIAEMWHEPERRAVLFVRNVPLRDDKILSVEINGVKTSISPADRRVMILGDESMGKPGLVHDVDLTKEQAKQLWAELKQLSNKYVDPLGKGPLLLREIGTGKNRIKYGEQLEQLKNSAKPSDQTAYKNAIARIRDINSREYNALGITPEEVTARLADYNDDKKYPQERRDDIEEMFKEFKAVSKKQAELDEIGNFWSRPVANMVNMYDYEYYMPFKGRGVTEDQLASFNTNKTGNELHEKTHAMDGRFSLSESPVLQLMSDAYRAAGRAGRRNLTPAIKNAIEQGLIDGGEIVETIPFANREIALEQYKDPSYMFNYNRDGSIDVMKITGNRDFLEALRYQFREANPLVDVANDITGFFGRQHTRYNYNFAALNFVRDTLTNAWNIGASGELGPAKAARYLKYIAAMVAKNGLGKAWQVARLHDKGTPESIKQLKLMAEKDPFTKALLEMIQHGGKTSYIDGFSLASNLEKLNKGLKHPGVIDTLDGFTNLVDSWNYMFEFTSRTAAYILYKEEMLKKEQEKNIAAGHPEYNVAPAPGKLSRAEVAAANTAAVWTKNLANFEHSGTYGRQMGALYMFIRPSATGAARAIEAILPAFTTEKQALAALPRKFQPNEKGELTEKQKVDRAKFLVEFRKDRRNARVMGSTLMGMGAAMYFMSLMMADDDDWGRNKTKNDNMQQWTRYARFPIPGTDIILQIPWGFGLGAFAASGAQFAAMSVGNMPIGEGISSIATNIATDAFLPIPISKIPVTDFQSGVGWAVDSILPTFMRPLGEFLMNKDGLGRAITSSSTRRMGDSFTGSDRINEMYKDAAQYIYRATSNFETPIDLSPNEVYFFANSYIDGISKLGEVTYSWALLGQDKKDFTAKTDVPFLGSFIGGASNVDSREYANMENKIKKIDKHLKTLEEKDIELLVNYEMKYPMYSSVVDAYRAGQGRLNKLRKEANEIRAMAELTPKERNEQLKLVITEQNMLKKEMVEDFKLLGLD